MSLQSYKDLDVWKLGVELAATVDDLSEKLIRNRRFAMANQLSRAALSVR
ncbi:MAG TPA: four helix bundle protein [Gemmatimonadaceae bacterium]|nr:four helix bundle protein [Gemmatimonadaceae bacterium]